jgi:hypothetical protein
MGIKMAIILHVAEQVVSEKWVVEEHVVGIRLAIVREVLTKLVVLVVEEQRSPCLSCIHHASGILRLSVHLRGRGVIDLIQGFRYCSIMPYPLVLIP